MRTRMVIILGVVGVLVGVAMSDGPRDSETGLGLAIGLILLGLSVWHYRSWGLGKLVGMGLLAVSLLMFYLADFGSGEWVWDQGLTGDDLAGHWVVIASAAVVLGGLVWSLIEEVAVADGRREEVTASLAFWRKWWIPAVAAPVVVWIVGILTADINYSSLEDEGEAGAIPDEWSIVTHLSDDGSTYQIVHMITTLSPLDESDVDGLRGRLVWPGAELELCGVGIMSAVEGAVQVGGYFPNTEECEPAMTEAFDEHGLPETGCLSVRIDGVDDEKCAPLALDETEIEGSHSRPRGDDAIRGNVALRNAVES